MNVPNAKRLWIITDTHLGIRNSSEEWIQIMRKYFFEWFIPKVKKEYKPGDVLLHLGDVYDSRQSINLKVLNLCVEIFGELSKVFEDGVYVIIGNHDIYSKAFRGLEKVQGKVYQKKCESANLSQAKVRD